MKLDPVLHPILLALADADLHADTPRVAPVETGDPITAARDRLTAAQLDLADRELSVSRIEQDIAKLSRRKAADRKQLGAATAIDTRRDLTHDLASAERRSAELEAEHHTLTEAVAAARETVAACENELRAAETAPTRPETDPAEDHATPLRAHLPETVLAAYDRQREESGAGAARFTGRSCENCSIMLTAGDIAAITAAPADELPHCPECGTYLVRTSGE
ncbi:MAG: hypothetical protein SPI77_02860 [Corynebacterium sp.]|nr:hypothetical protein [Corynebacterium sp.]